MEVFPGLDYAKKFASWHYLESFNDVGGLTEKECLDIRDAIGTLRRLLGDKFLEGAAKVRHPILEMIGNHAPWTRLWLRWFADALIVFKGDPKFPKLKDKLIDPKEYGEAIFLLEVGHLLNQAAFKVQLEVPVASMTKSSADPPKPDFQVTNPDTNEVFFVECKYLGWSSGAKNAVRDFNRITTLLDRKPPQLMHSGRVLKLLSRSRLESVCARVKDFLETLEQDDCFKELIIPRILELAVASPSREGDLEAWSLTRNLRRGSFHSADDDTNDFRRVRERIAAAQKQLPKDRANVVVIQTRLFALQQSSVPRFIDAVEEGLCDFPHVKKVIVMCPFFGPNSTQHLAFGAHVAFVKTLHKIEREARVLLLNEFAEYHFTEATSEALTRAFRDF